MLKSKLKKAKFLLCIVILVAIFMVPVSASTTSYYYTFSGPGPHWNNSHNHCYKDDDEQTAYASITYSQNWNGERVYLWVRCNYDNDDTDYTSSNAYFTQFGNYSLHYNYNTYTGQDMDLYGWHNNYDSSRTFSIGGHFTP